MEAKVLTHCFQGLYYLLRHPGFIGWAARRRLGWVGVGEGRLGWGAGGGCCRQAALIYRKPSGGNNAATSQSANPTAHLHSRKCTLKDTGPPRPNPKSPNTPAFFWAQQEEAGLMRHQGELENLSFLCTGRSESREPFVSFCCTSTRCGSSGKTLRGFCMSKKRKKIKNGVLE